MRKRDKEYGKIIKDMCASIGDVIFQQMRTNGVLTRYENAERKCSIGDRPTDKELHDATEAVIILPVDCLVRVLKVYIQPIALAATADGGSVYAEIREQLIRELDIAAFDVIRAFEQSEEGDKHSAEKLRKSLQDVGV